MALFGSIFVGIIQTTYPLFTYTRDLSIQTTQDIEAAFVIGKIDWMLGQTETILFPDEDHHETILSIRTFDDQIHILKVDDDVLVLSVDSGEFLPIVSTRTGIQTLTATHKTLNSDRTLEISLSLNGKNYGPLLYHLQN